MGLYRPNSKINAYIILGAKTLFTGLLCLGFLFYLRTEYPKIIFSHKVMRLNVLMPQSYEPILKYAKKEGPVQEKIIISYINFYSKFTEYFPEQSESYGMLGFCYYQLGRTEKALEMYQKAVALSPGNFWFHYNLGVIYFKAQNYQDAIVHLKKAIFCRADTTLKIIGSSPAIYRAILLSDTHFAGQTMLRLAQGYHDAYRMLVVSHALANDYLPMIFYAQKAVELKQGLEEDFYYYIGIALFQLKEYKKASLYFEEALKKNPNFMEATQSLSLCYYSMGLPDKAKALIVKFPLLVKNMKGADVLNARYVTVQMF